MEAILARPEKPLIESIARVSVTETGVQIFFPERREEFRQIMRRRGLRWNAPVFARQIPDDGIRPHRAAELIHDLLAAGFCVKADQALVEMAIHGRYDSEPLRIVSAASGEYAGWFRIWWQYDEDCYAVAKMLPGSRYHKPCVVVPAEQYEEVLDFAQIHGFILTEKALALAEQARAERESAIVVSLTAPPPAGYTRARPALEPEEDLEIDPDLLDYDLDDED